MFMQNASSYIANIKNSCKFENQLLTRPQFVAFGKHWLRISV
jgi:hypothetical protein